MKKQVLFFLSVIVALTSGAQTQPSFGIGGGLSSATLKGDAASSLQSLLNFADGAITTDSRTGFFGGGTITIPISEQIALEPALYYAQKGYELKGGLTIKGAGFIGANAKARLTTHYIDLPLLLKGTFSGFQVFAGPQVSYLANADLRTTAGVLGFNVLNRSIDATRQFNRWDAAITGGIGYQFINGFNVRAAYDHGLSKVDANKNLDSYNRSFKVGVGFTF